MKKTLVFSMMLCGSLSLALAGCTKDDQGGGTETNADTNADADTDADTNAEVGETGGTENGGDGDGDGDGTTSASTGLTTGDFVPDEGDLPSVSECDPFMQDCPEGEKCVPYGSTGGNWDANKCVPVTGSGAAGDTCTYGGATEATDDCDENTHCWDAMDVDGQLVGVCTEFCGGTPDDPQCDGDTSCLIANEGSINLCITNCDPLLQDCNDGLACFFAAGNFNCIFTTSDIPTGDPCAYINDCAGGNTCLNAEIMPNCNGSSCCGNWCDLDDPTCPQEGTECTAFFEEGMAPPSFETVGVCILPGS